ncbi:hypothetical protein M947_10795 [Sulfurimonas hongkongensis]|uniref:Uncharacterized protein n=1 Tax=Sulfurimonas hongkongensis TaxID=1172190 RepID=T0J914_9BACT|nr:DpnI domain-containing protein [Sulfurimonas hongkongensis]EQB34486.1 hypothetical protein M947_10795 [Sulfurimonas hongkongensis]
MKSKKGNPLGKTIADGAYNTMIERIIGDTSLNFFFREEISEEIVLDYSDFNDNVKIEMICEKNERSKTYK